MPYNFVADSFHTKKLCSRLSSSEARFYAQNGCFSFLSTLWGLRTTYDDHLRLIGKSIVDFLLALIELFSLGVAAEVLRANIGSKSAISLQRGPVDPKFHLEWVTPTKHSTQKTRLNDFSHVLKIWTDLSSVLSQCTSLTDGQRDGRTDRIFIARSRLHSMQRGKNTVRQQAIG